MRVLLCGVFAGLVAISANAVTIKNDGGRGGLNFIAITGEITRGDAGKFDRIVSTISGPTIVLLEGPGGLIVDGLNIGSSIRNRGVSTGVAVGAKCASVCA